MYNHILKIHINTLYIIHKQFYIYKHSTKARSNIWVSAMLFPFCPFARLPVLPDQCPFARLPVLPDCPFKIMG